MPELLERIYFGIHLASGFIGVQNGICFFAGLSAQYKNQFLRFARLQCQFCLQGTAGVDIVVQLVITLAAFHCNRVGIGSVSTDKMFQTAIVTSNWCPYHAKEAAGGIFFTVLTDVLHDFVAFQCSTGDKQGILQVDLILFVIVLVGKFHKAERRKFSGAVTLIGNHSTPNFMGCTVWHIIGYIRANTAVFCGNDCISGTMPTGAFISVQRLADRLPGSRPIISSLVVPQVNIPPRQCHIGVKAIACNSAVGTGFYKAVAAGIVGNDSTVFR